jgi:2-oxoglutarate dehydrogenase E2 component (dihydrolipoamide succinyltransferase)
MRELLLPKYNNNDTTCILVSWLADDGAKMDTDSVVAEVETAKAVEELVVDEAAVLHRLVPENTECAFGQAVALLFESEQERAEYLAKGGGESSKDTAGDGLVLSDAARKLVAEHGITADRLRAIGKTVIKTADIEALLATPAGERTFPLSRHQLAVGAVVEEAHRTIPAAFAAVKVRLAAFEAAQAGSTGVDETAFGLVEVLIKAIAACQAHFPLFFGTLRDGGTVALSETANVGVTLDLGKGLFIPVVLDAANRSIHEVTDDLMDFRIKALRQGFREQDMAAENITLSLHNDQDIVLAGPIIHPGRTCVVTLCATQHEVCLAEDGTPFTSAHTTIAITYDHRVINGRDAVLFLTEVKRALENPDTLAALVS